MYIEALKRWTLVVDILGYLSMINGPQGAVPERQLTDKPVTFHDIQVDCLELTGGGDFLHNFTSLATLLLPSIFVELLTSFILLE